MFVNHSLLWTTTRVKRPVSTITRTSVVHGLLQIPACETLYVVKNNAVVVGHAAKDQRCMRSQGEKLYE